MKIRLFVLACVCAVMIVSSASAQYDNNLSANSVTGTLIPGEWGLITITPAQASQRYAIELKNAPSGISHFGVRLAQVGGQDFYLVQFYVDSSLKPGQYDLVFAGTDVEGLISYTSSRIVVGHGMPADFRKLANKLASDVYPLEHANLDDGSFQAITHYRTTRTTQSIAKAYKKLLDPADDKLQAQRWDITTEQLSEFDGLFIATRNGVEVVVWFSEDPLTREHYVTVGVTFPNTN